MEDSVGDAWSRRAYASAETYRDEVAQHGHLKLVVSLASWDYMQREGIAVFTKGHDGLGDNRLSDGVSRWRNRQRGNQV